MQRPAHTETTPCQKWLVAPTCCARASRRWEHSETEAMKIKIRENIRTVKPFSLNQRQAQNEFSQSGTPKDREI